MKKIIKLIKAMSLKKKIQLCMAIVLTLGLTVMIPVYAWFNNQKKSAELFKVKYPNSLFINAAHREDRKFFNLDELDVKEDVAGVPVLSKMYVFSVSGESTYEFTLQMAHTNNNGFTYKIYNATELPSESGSVISYDLHDIAIDIDNVGPEENKPENTIDFGDSSLTKAYYTKGTLIEGENKNVNDPNDPNSAILDKDDPFYSATYGSNENVHEDVVPTYWQEDIPSGMDPNTKKFCKYFILEVSWSATHINNKETDLIYLSVIRKN